MLNVFRGLTRLTFECWVLMWEIWFRRSRLSIYWLSNYTWDPEEIEKGVHFRVIPCDPLVLLRRISSALSMSVYLGSLELFLQWLFATPELGRVSRWLLCVHPSASLECVTVLCLVSYKQVVKTRIPLETSTCLVPYSHCSSARTVS